MDPFVSSEISVGKEDRGRCDGKATLPYLPSLLCVINQCELYHYLHKRASTSGGIDAVVDFVFFPRPKVVLNGLSERYCSFDLATLSMTGGALN